MPNTGSGRLGEQLTAEYLEEKGYEIVAVSYTHLTLPTT